MGFFRKTFRIWWQKPRKLEDIEENREVTFLELFYDLAYVGIIYQITHGLIDHLSVGGIIMYIFLYVMIFFAWVNGTWYHELHGNNDLRTRVFTFLQVFALTFIGIFAPTAFSEGGADGFAVAYIAFMIIITWLWASTGIYDKMHRVISMPYSLGFSFTITLFIISLFVPAPVKFYLWFFGIAFAFFMPIVLPLVIHTYPQHRELGLRIRPSLAERFGLLTIIVLGEVIASIMRSASHHEYLTHEIILYIFESLAIATTLWWLYSDLVARRLPIQKDFSRMAWMYLHFPVTLSIGLVAGGLYALLEDPENITSLDKWIVIGPIVTFLLSLKLLIYTLQGTNKESQIVYRRSGEVALLAGLCILIVGLLDIPMAMTLALCIFFLLFPVFFAIRSWITYRVSLQEKSASISTEKKA